MMLQRNLLYTAVTRAKRLVVLVGSRRALAKAVGTPERRPPLRRPHPTAPAATGENGCGGQQGRSAATGSGRAQGADPRSGQAGRQDGQGDARAAHRMAILESPEGQRNLVCLHR
jgi:hypothetical protein